MHAEQRLRGEALPGHGDGILVAADGGCRDRSDRNDRRWALVVLAAIVALWAALALPIVAGERTLLLRDVFTTHLPYKWFGADALAHGSIPAVNPTWALGQPFRGNPNALPFYPGNLLYLALPFRSAFGLHYVGHWLLAFFTMRALARRLGQSSEAALLAGLAYAGSGLLLSLLTFYNLLAVAAWAPAVLAGAVAGGRRGVAAGGLACGLMLLGGEPVAAALVVPALAVAACEGRSFRRGVAVAAAIGALGLVVALPQLVATARILDFTWRAAHGLPADQVGQQALHPLRLLELVLPLPWGWPGQFGRFGYWSKSVTPHVPYIYSIHVGVVAAALAAAAARRRWRWSALAGGALLLAWAGGLSGAATLAATGGLFRYPQKLVLLFTLAAAPLAGWGLDRARESAGVRRLLVGLGALCAGAALLGWLVRSALAETLRQRLVEGGDALRAATAAGGWIVGFALAGATLLAAAWALRARRPALAVAVQLAALLQLAPAFVTGRVVEYRSPSPFAEAIATADGSPRTLLTVPLLAPDWEPRPPHRLEDGIRDAIGVSRSNVEPPFGVPLGFRYPLAPDLEGLTSPLSVFLMGQLALADWPERVAWLRRLGVGWVVRYGDEPVPGLERAATGVHAGATVGLDRVDAPAPVVRWPERVVAARSPIETWIGVARGVAGEGPAATATAIASRPVEHRAGAAVTLVEESPDRLVVDVDGGGGLLVFERTWLPIYRARTANGVALATQPVDIALLGVEVPAGKKRVVVDVSNAPELAAGAIALVAALAALANLVRARPRRVPA